MESRKLGAATTHFAYKDANAFSTLLHVNVIRRYMADKNGWQARCNCGKATHPGQAPNPAFSQAMREAPR
jgi:hypothetical protein